MLEPVLTAAHCTACRKCCKFEPYELLDAPLFTDEQRDLVGKLPDGARIGFEAAEGLWRVKLEPVIGTDQYRCPVLDDRTGCRLGEQRPFDCQAFPYYVMKKGDQIVIALSPICPVLSPDDGVRAKSALEGGLLSRLIEGARANSQSLVEYRDDLQIIAHLGSWNDLFNGRDGSE